MDATKENIRSIQQLIAERQGQLNKTIGKSRAYHQACDEVGPTLKPPMTGVELEKWIGAVNGATSHIHPAINQITLPHTETGTIVIKAQIVDDDQDFQARREGTMSSAITEQCRPLQVGQTVQITLCDVATARRAQQSACHVAKALNWPFLPNGNRGYATRIVGNVLKIKRLA